MYNPHPSRALNLAFKDKPYQGVAPEDSTFLFIGLDANYDANIEDRPVFHDVMEYHKNGVTFWQRHKVHHPFLLNKYSGNGKRYHHNFAKIGFQPEHASQISFAELMHIPTVGRSLLTMHDLEIDHLKRLNKAILEGSAKHIFLSDGVMKLMDKTRLFPWLKLKEDRGTAPLGSLARLGDKTVYSHLHFSNYGKFQIKMTEQAAAIKALL